MTNTVTINTNGESVEIEVEELSSVKKMKWAAEAPDSLKDGEPEDVNATKETFQFMIDLASEQTILTEELLNKLPPEKIGQVLGDVIAYAFGNEPVREESDDGGIDIGKDGSVDLDDWR